MVVVAAKMRATGALLEGHAAEGRFNWHAGVMNRGTSLANNGGSQANDDAETAAPLDRKEILESGRVGNALAYTGIAVGGIGLILGVTFVAMGAKKKKEAKTAALRPQVTPYLGRDGAGASLTLEF